MTRIAECAHVAILLFCASVPLFIGEGTRERPTRELPAFPSEIDGRTLTPLAPLEVEEPWLAQFPGRVGRFTDGERTWILRQISVPTLALHSSARCLRAVGWVVEPASAVRDGRGRIWSEFVARRGEGTERVREIRVREIVESLATGATWPDVDAWRWQAWRGADPGPWCARTSVDGLE